MQLNKRFLYWLLGAALITGSLWIYSDSNTQPPSAVSWITFTLFIALVGYLSHTDEERQKEQVLKSIQKDHWSKVLIVENNTDLQKTYSTALSSKGLQAICIRNSEEALAVALKHQPELIITELLLPKISGFEMIANLKQAPRAKHIPILVVSSLGSPEDKRRAYSVGASDYIRKSSVNVGFIARRAKEIINAAQRVNK